MFTLLICPRLLISKLKSNPLPLPNNSKLGPCLTTLVVLSYVGSLYPLPVSVILISVTTPPCTDACNVAVLILLIPIKFNSSNVSIL